MNQQIPSPTTPKILFPPWAVRVCLLITRVHRTGGLWNAETMYWSIPHPRSPRIWRSQDRLNLTLYAASSAPDTDFTATLVDVHPGGKAINICEGILRTRFRNSYEEPTLIEPETICAYKIILWETSNLFKAGHQIRVEVSSSNFPRFDRNQNTGSTPGLDAEMELAHQTIYHNAQYPSHITLPVIPPMNRSPRNGTR